MDTFDPSSIEDMRLTDAGREIYNTIIQFLILIHKGENSDLCINVCVALSSLPEGKTDKNVIGRLSLTEQKEFDMIVQFIESAGESRKDVDNIILSILEHLSHKEYWTSVLRDFKKREAFTLLVL